MNIFRNQLMREMRGYGRTLKEIGDRWGLSRERVRQIIGSMPAPKKFNRCKNCWRKTDRNLQYCNRECISKYFYRTRVIKPYSLGLVIELTCSKCGIKFNRSRRHMAIDLQQNGPRKNRYCGKCSEQMPWKMGIKGPRPKPQAHEIFH